MSLLLDYTMLAGVSAPKVLSRRDDQLGTLREVLRRRSRSEAASWLPTSEHSFFRGRAAPQGMPRAEPRGPALARNRIGRQPRWKAGLELETKAAAVVLRLLLAFLLALFHRRLEIPDAFAQALAQVGQLAGAKDEKRDRQNYQQFHRANFSTKHNYLLGVPDAPKRAGPRTPKIILGQRPARVKMPA